MVVNSVGIITPGCKDCKMLKKRLVSSFSRFGIEIQFEEIDYTLDEEQAMKACEEFGFDDIPAFEVYGEVFKKGFEMDQVEKVAEELLTP